MLSQWADFIARASANISIAQAESLPRNAVSMGNDESTAAKRDAAIRALDELFSNPNGSAHVYHSYVLVQQPSGQLAFEQEAFEFYFEQAVAKALGQRRPRRRIITIAL
jgi:hypothetical protein